MICAFVLLAIGVQLQAEEPNALQKYTITLDRVEFQPDATYVHLSNGAVYSNTLLPSENELLKLWNPGDHIDAEINIGKIKSLSLIDLDAKILYSPQVALELSSQKNLPTIEKIEKSRNLELASIKVFDSNLLLSDGSSWVSHYEDYFRYWKVGDHINISYAPHDRGSEQEDGDEFNYVGMINCDLVQVKDYDSSAAEFKTAPAISQEQFPTIQKIEVRKEFEWSSVPTAFLILSDRSRWKTSLYNKKDAQKLEVWFVGDKVIYDKYERVFTSITNYSIISIDMDADAAIYFEAIK